MVYADFTTNQIPVKEQFQVVTEVFWKRRNNWLRTFDLDSDVHKYSRDVVIIDYVPLI